MSVITVVTRIFPKNAHYKDSPDLLKPSDIGVPIHVHKCTVVDPRTGAEFLLETSFCLGKTKNLENLKVPGLVPLTSLDSALNYSKEKKFGQELALSVPKNIPIQKIPPLQKYLKNTHLEKPHIKLHLNLKKIREATKKKHLTKKKGKLVRPLCEFFKDNECLICGFILEDSRKSKIRSHMISHIKLGTYSCPNCENKCFSTAEALYNHSVEHTERMDYICAVCDFKCNRKHFLVTHYKSLHHNPPPKQTSCLVTSFMCSVCGIKLTSWKALADHKNTHFGTESYSCFVCDKTFSGSSALLRYHAHPQLTSNFHKCKYCKKVLSSKHTLREHEKRHLIKRQHICRLCGKKFNFKNNLNKHLNLHFITL